MALDLKKFKKVGATSSHTIFEHPEGHVIHVAHKPLDKSTRQEMRGLPMNEGGVVSSRNPNLKEPYKEFGKLAAPNQPLPQVDEEKAKKFAQSFDDGGQVQPVPQPPEEPGFFSKLGEAAKKSFMTDPMVAGAKLGFGAANNTMETGDPMQSQQPSAPPVSNQQPQQQQPQFQQGQDPFGFQEQEKNIREGIEKQQNAATSQGIAESENARASEKIYKRQAQELQALPKVQDAYSKMVEQNSRLQEDLMNGHINPNQVIEKMTTGGRMLTAIGLALSGLGSGMSHQPNLAAKFLEDQINRDVEAQKFDIGTKKSLLDSNIKQFGSYIDGIAATKMQYMDIVSAQLAAEAAKSKDPMALSRAMGINGVIQESKAAELAQSKMRSNLVGGMQRGQVRPEQTIMLLVPEKERPAALKELKEMQDQQSAKENMLAAFDKVADLNTIGNRVTHLGFEPPAVSALKAPATAEMAKAFAGRFTENENKVLQDVWKNPGNSEETRKIKRDSLETLLNQKMHYPTLDFYGIKPSLGKTSLGVQPNPSVPKGNKR